MLPASVNHVPDARWRTRFGSWVQGYGVERIVRALDSEPRLRVTGHAVYGWILGRTRPDPDRARFLVQLSRGALTLDAIYAHRSEMRMLRKADHLAAARSRKQPDRQEAT